MHPIVLYDVIKMLKDNGVVRAEDLAAICQKHQRMNSESECNKLTKDVKLTWLEMSLV
jgi:hypothetical protein